MKKPHFTGTCMQYHSTVSSGQAIHTYSAHKSDASCPTLLHVFTLPTLSAILQYVNKTWFWEKMQFPWCHLLIAENWTGSAKPMPKQTLIL